MESTIEMLGGQLLSYGVSGFALLMIGFTYYLMKTELKRDEPRHIAIKTIWMFMGLVIVSTVVVGFFSVPIANKNVELNDEVDELSVDISALMNRLTTYEFAINELAYKLDKANSKTPPTSPPRQTGPITLDTMLVSKYVDFSRVTVPKVYKKEELDVSKRADIKKSVRDRLDRYQIRSNLVQ